MIDEAASEMTRVEGSYAATGPVTVPMAFAALLDASAKRVGEEG